MASVVEIVAAGALVAAFVQGLSGFAFGLTAMSIWAWTLEPHLAAVLVVFGSLVGQIIAAVTVRPGFEARRLAPYLVGGLAGIPLGVALLPHVDAAVFKLLLGGLLAVWCPLMLLSDRLPRIEWGGPIADGAAGLSGGFFGGLGGFSGVIPTLWVNLRGLDKGTRRALIQNFNLITLAATMAVYVATGVVERPMLPLLALVASIGLVPTLLGARLYAQLDEKANRRVVLGLLTLSGVALLASSLGHLLGRG